jgi:hypothetical protein
LERCEHPLAAARRGAAIWGAAPAILSPPVDVGVCLPGRERRHLAGLRVVWPLHFALGMRNLSILALSGLVVAALGGLAQADHKATVAALDAPSRASSRGERLRAQLTGELHLAAPAAERPARLAGFLEASDVTAQIAPRAAELERCYLTHLTDARDAGHLDVLFEIGRDGHVRSIATAAGGLSPGASQEVTSCIRAIAQRVQFPARRNDTTVVLPYYFQKTRAPDAGPQLSCYRAKGCP